MRTKLMPSQKEYLRRILELGNKSFRRGNIILFGNSQTGKTELAKHLSKKNEKYKYINFTKDYMEEFISNKRLQSIEFPDFEQFLRKEILNNKNKNEIIILDEIDSLIAIITENDKQKLFFLYKQFLTMDQSIKYIFITSIFNQYIVEKLVTRFHERILKLPFCREDKEFIIKNCFNNINLFELEKVINLRQMCKKNY